jgi:hypothetical protein
MAEERAATQLPLFETEPLANPDLPPRWNTFGHSPAETLLTDLTGTNLHLVSLPATRDKRLRQDQDREDRMRALAARSHKEYDDVLAAYALYSNGQTEMAIFEDFADKFNRALSVGLINQWLERLSKHQSTARVGAITSTKAPLSFPVLKNEPGLGRMLGIKSSRNVKPLARDNSKPKF